MTDDNLPTPSEPTGFPQISGLDTQQAAQRLGNDRAFFLDLLERFVGQFADAAEQTRRDINQGDRVSAKVRLHSLRGNVGNLGGTELMALAQTLETAVVDGTAALALEPHLTAFADQLRQLIMWPLKPLLPS